MSHTCGFEYRLTAISPKCFCPNRQEDSKILKSFFRSGNQEQL
jgi:hypothetical protein